MSAHVRTCAHCGTGPNALNPASFACCWNPIGCGCGVVALPGGESTSSRLRQVQEALAASQQDLTRALDDAASLRVSLSASSGHHHLAERERNEALHDLARARFEVEKTKTRLDHARGQVEQLRAAVAAVLAELRELADFNRADANRFAGTSSPMGFGPHRAAEAYEKAVALVETLGGESRG